MSELKPLPCPFCGSALVSTKYSMDGDSFVYCQDCLAQGPKMPSSYVSKWNQRQPHPDSELAEQYRLGYDAGLNHKDSEMLDWLEEREKLDIWITNEGLVGLNFRGTPFVITGSNLREAIQQAMEQEK